MLVLAELYEPSALVAGDRGLFGGKSLRFPQELHLQAAVRNVRRWKAENLGGRQLLLVFESGTWPVDVPVRSGAKVRYALRWCYPKLVLTQGHV